MKIVITYEVESALGHKVKRGAVAYTFVEAEELCRSVERVGYKLLDVTREE